MAKKAGVKENESIAAVAIPLEWYMPEGAITPLASNMTVQIMEGVIKVSFFEVKPPLVFDKSAPLPSKMRADCVASVFVIPDKLPEFIALLQTYYDKYMARKKES